MRIKVLGALCAVALVASGCGTSSSQVIVVEHDDERNAALPVDDGKPFLAVGCCVESIAKDSAGNIWVGGGNLVVGRATGGLAAFGPRPDSFDRVEGVVTSIVPDGQGGAYIAGGRIERVGRTATRNLVRIGPDGAMDPAFAPSWPDTTRVLSLAVQGTGAVRRVYVIVDQSGAPANTPPRLLALDPSTGAEVSAIDLRFGGASADISDAVLHPAGRGIVVVGRFAMDADGMIVAGAIFLDQSGRNIATLLLRRGQDGALPGRVTASDVTEGANRSDSIYVAGDFNDARVRAADGSMQTLLPSEVSNLTRLNWSDAGVTIGRYATLVGNVRTLDASRGPNSEVLHVGGDSFLAFSISGALLRPPNSNLAKLSRDDATRAVSLSAAEVDVNGYVSLVRRVTTPTGDGLVLSGGFTTARVGASLVTAAVRGFVVAQSGANGWRQLPGAFDHDGEGVIAAEWVGDHLLLGSDFRVMGYRVGSLLKLTPDGAFSTSIRQPLQPNGWVSAIAIKDGYVYVGGGFTEVGRTNPVATSGVIRYTEAGDFDAGFSRPITAPDGEPYINDIVFGPDKMYVGGKFNYNGVRDNFATFSLPGFTLVPGRSWESVDDTVWDIAVSADGGNVAVAGDFRKMGEWNRSPKMIMIDEVAGRIRDTFRADVPPGEPDASSVAFDDATGTVYTGFFWGLATITNQRLDGTIVNQFVDRPVRELAASNGRLYVGYSSMAGVSMRVVDTATNSFLADPPSYTGTSALFADERGVWMAGYGLRVGANPAYGPVYISRNGALEISPSAPQQPVAVDPVVSSDPAFGVPATPVAAPPAIEPEIDPALSAGTGRALDGAGTALDYVIKGDGTIVFDAADMNASPSASFMVSKLKPGDKAMTVTFRRPAGMTRVKVKAHPTGKTLTCSPGRKNSCTIRGLNPWTRYRFSVEGRVGGKTVVSPRSIAVKTLIKLGRNVERRLTGILPAPKGTSPKYSEIGACSLTSKRSKLKTPRTRVLCSVTVVVTRSGLPVSRTIAVKVG